MTAACPASRIRLTDLIGQATAGIRTGAMRTTLSVVGIAVGIAAIVTVVGFTRSSQADLVTRIDRLGTNLLTVVNGHTVAGDETQLPLTAESGAARIDAVQAVTATAIVPALRVYRSDRIPAYRSGGLDVRITQPTLLATLDGSLRAGTFLNSATARYPVVVLGDRAAIQLGIDGVGPGVRVWLGGRWFVVAGILQPLELAPEIDRSALVGPTTAHDLFGYDGHPTRLYVRTETQRTAEVANMLARAVNPADPSTATVSRPSDALASRLLVTDSMTVLGLGLGGVALLVGGIGIANTMVITVLERRREIGLRRALGATRRHIGSQFLAESLLLAAAGGLCGIALGITITYIAATANGWQMYVPAESLIAATTAALLIGALAGLYPAARAARLHPADALRTS